MILRVVDVETTGLERPDAAVCEIGWTDIETVTDDNLPYIKAPQSLYVNPGHPIPPAMSGIHHIVDADVVGAPSLADAVAEMMITPADILCAHFAKFEQKFLAIELPWICSYKVSIDVAPNAPEHKLQTLRYWAKLDVDPTLAFPPHRSGPDTYVCACLIARLLVKRTPEQMIAISAAPILLPKLHFGEHASKPIAEVPLSYFSWIVNPPRPHKKPFDEDVLYTANHHLRSRKKENGQIS